MESPVFFFIIVAAVVGFAIFHFSKKQIIKRTLRKAPSKDISEFKDGDVARIIGDVSIIQKPLIAPLSKRECAYYYVRVDKKTKQGDNSTWVKIIEEEISSNFLVQNNNSYAYIPKRSIEAYVVRDRSYSSGFLNDATDNLEEYLNQHGTESEGLLGFNKSLRYKEGVLEVGERIAVLGQGFWRDAEDLNLPAKYGKVLEIGPANAAPIYLSDDPETTIAKAVKITKERAAKEKKEQIEVKKNKKTKKPKKFDPKDYNYGKNYRK